jgi:hypothetical protein
MIDIGGATAGRRLRFFIVDVRIVVGLGYGMTLVHNLAQQSLKVAQVCMKVAQQTAKVAQVYSKVAQQSPKQNPNTLQATIIFGKTLIK